MKIHHFIIFVLAFVIGGLFGSVAHAEIISLGKVGGNLFVYDSDTIVSNDNITGVWVLTSSPKYNVTNNKKYAVFGVHVLLDCVGHTYAVDELKALDRNGKVIGVRHIVDVHFSEANKDTIPKTLLRHACKITG